MVHRAEMKQFALRPFCLEHDGGDSSTVWCHKLPSSVHHSDTTIMVITTDSTGLYQMLGISCPFGCHGLCPAALLETHCAGLQVLMRCQKGHGRVLRKRNGNYTVATYTALHWPCFWLLRQSQRSQRCRLMAHYAWWTCWPDEYPFVYIW